LGVEAFGFENPADIAALPLFALRAYGKYYAPKPPFRWRSGRIEPSINRERRRLRPALTRLQPESAEAEPEEWVEFRLLPSSGKRGSLAESFARLSNPA
jgi:hypothetical protein